MENRVENENIVKITVTKEAGNRLNEILAKVNEGFDAGKVTRQDVASWMIERFEKSLSENEIQTIRKEFFSETVLLESILKKAKSTGDVPEFLRDALKKQWALGLSSGVGSQANNRRSAKNQSVDMKSQLTKNTETNSEV